MRAHARCDIGSDPRRPPRRCARTRPCARGARWPRGGAGYRRRDGTGVPVAGGRADRPPRITRHWSPGPRRRRGGGHHRQGGEGIDRPATPRCPHRWRVPQPAREQRNGDRTRRRPRPTAPRGSRARHRGSRSGCAGGVSRSRTPRHRRRCRARHGSGAPYAASATATLLNSPVMSPSWATCRARASSSSDDSARDTMPSIP